MVQLWQRHDLPINLMLLDVLVKGQIYPDFLDSVEVGIETMFYLVAHSESSTAKKAELLKGVLISSIF